MTDAAITEPPTRKNLLFASGIGFTFAAALIVLLVTHGDPKNDLHMKALGASFDLIWLAAGVLLGTIVTQFAVFKK